MQLHRMTTTENEPAPAENFQADPGQPLLQPVHYAATASSGNRRSHNAATCRAGRIRRQYATSSTSFRYRRKCSSCPSSKMILYTAERS
jgi:hypothetical protein